MQIWKREVWVLVRPKSRNEVGSGLGWKDRPTPFSFFPSYE